MKSDAVPSAAALATLLWRRFAWRHWLQSPGQYALLVAIVAMGVAVFVSIRLANRAAVAGFENFTEAITGESDFTIVPNSGVLAVDVLREIRQAFGAEPVHLVPVVETSAVRPRQSGDETVGREAFQIIGIDLLAAGNILAENNRSGSFFAASEDENASPDLNAYLNGGDRAWISPALAARDGLASGDTINLILDDAPAPITVAGVIPTTEGVPPPALTMMIMDLPRLNSLLGRSGLIDRIEVAAPAGPQVKQRRVVIEETLTTLSHRRWDVETPGSRRATGETMTAAFRLNLTVLSLIALLVGLLLIAQALDGAVVRRRQEIAILRSLGIEPRQIHVAWLIEAGMVGVAGSAFGVLLGWAGAQFAVRFVARTVNALYYGNTVDAAAIHLGEVGGSLLVGIAASVVAGWIPARSAGSTPPAQLLGRGHIPSGLAFLSRKSIGIALIVFGLLVYFLPPLQLGGGARFPLAGYTSAFTWILGFGLLAGAIFKPVSIPLRVLARRSATLRVAVGHLLHPTGRHRLAVAGLVAAVGMTAGMIILVASFDHTIRGWIAQNLRADLFIASDAAQNASTNAMLGADTWREIIKDPGIAGAELFQSHRVRIDGLVTMAAGFDTRGNAPDAKPAWIAGPVVSVTAAATDPTAAYASESFSERFGVGVGDALDIPTPSGPKAVTIAGIFADYGNERGSILVAREHLAAWFSEDRLTNLSAYLAANAEAENVRNRLLNAYPGLRVLTNADLRAAILVIFRQTFSITHALELIGVAVAVAGLAVTLASMFLDRRDELTTLRALGLTRGEMARVAAWEGGVTASIGVVGGIALSAVLGHLLVFVINKQSFGWTLQFVIPALPLVLLASGVVAAGVCASWVVGRWGAVLPADREE